MKAKNVKVGVGVVIKECVVGYARDHIGKRGVISELDSSITCSVDVGGVSVLVYYTEIRKMKSSDLDEAPIAYTHPMQEHLGKEVVVEHNGCRGWVVGYSDHMEDPSPPYLLTLELITKGIVVLRMCRNHTTEPLARGARWMNYDS